MVPGKWVWTFLRDVRKLGTEQVHGHLALVSTVILGGCEYKMERYEKARRLFQRGALAAICLLHAIQYLPSSRDTCIGDGTTCVILTMPVSSKSDSDRRPHVSCPDLSAPGPALYGRMPVLFWKNRCPETA